MTRETPADTEYPSDATGRLVSDGGEEPVLSLPADLRDELKDPLGPVETDADRLLDAVSGQLLAVGDVVTYHLLQANRQPDVAVVDGRTKREAVDAEIERAVTEGAHLTVDNPPAKITASLVQALDVALDRDEPTTILVDGEEDLAALPAIVMAPVGASVVYGQPDEGMVHVRVDEDVSRDVHSLLERFDGDSDRVLEPIDRS